MKVRRRGWQATATRRHSSYRRRCERRTVNRSVREWINRPTADRRDLTENGCMKSASIARRLYWHICHCRPIIVPPEVFVEGSPLFRVVTPKKTPTGLVHAVATSPESLFSFSDKEKTKMKINIKYMKQCIDTLVTLIVVHNSRFNSFHHHRHRCRRRRHQHHFSRS